MRQHELDRGEALERIGTEDPIATVTIDGETMIYYQTVLSVARPGVETVWYDRVAQRKEYQEET